MEYRVLLPQRDMPNRMRASLFRKEGEEQDCVRVNSQLKPEELLQRLEKVSLRNLLSGLRQSPGWEGAATPPKKGGLLRHFLF